MKSRGIGLGLFVLTIGIIWLLFNFNILDWRLLESLWVLWPLVFVVIGINIMFRHNPNVRIGVWLVFLAVVIGYSLYIDKDSSRHSAAAQHNIIQYNKSGEKSSVLDLDLGGYKFDIDSTEGALLEGNVYGPGIKHSINRSGNAAVVKIKDSIIADEWSRRFKKKSKEDVCTITSGFLAGMFSYIFKKEVDCVERECKATGKDFCLFEIA
jgi:hypothetical protein